MAWPEPVSLAYQEDESFYQEKASEPGEAGQVKVPSKRPYTANDDDNECNDQGDDGTSREAEIADMNVAIVGQDEAPDEAAKPEVGVGWSELELGLYEKGLQVFGKNRYVISPVRLLLWYRWSSIIATWITSV
jgi:hypothetical protein